LTAEGKTEDWKVSLEMDGRRGAKASLATAGGFSRELRTSLTYKSRKKDCAGEVKRRRGMVVWSECSGWERSMKRQDVANGRLCCRRIKCGN